MVCNAVQGLVREDKVSYPNIHQTYQTDALALCALRRAEVHRLMSMGPADLD